MVTSLARFVLRNMSVACQPSRRIARMVSGSLKQTVSLISHSTRWHGHVVMVEAGKDLGAWCGLAKLDSDGSVKKAVRTSCAVITDFGEETHALSVLLDYLQKQADAAEI